MSVVRISHPTKILKGNIQLPASKSISNRLLILQQIVPYMLSINNLSSASDTKIMKKACKIKTGTVNINNAGTCMRFLTALYAAIEGSDIILHGDERMHERPVAPLVDALVTLGADIDYIDKIGFPPLRIKGKKLKGGIVSVDSSYSSQFVSALMMIAPLLEQGIVINDISQLVSKPYVHLTADLMRACGFDVVVQTDLVIKPGCKRLSQLEIDVEGDWSASAFWYVMASLSNESELILEPLQANSEQGDKEIANYMLRFGVDTHYAENQVQLTRNNHYLKKAIYNMQDFPDLVPAMAVLFCALQIEATFTHVGHLQLKETKRLSALCNELEKCGYDISHQSDTLIIKPTLNEITLPDAPFETYGDHRMAMSLSALSLVFPYVDIRNPDVVSKSYPHYWDDMIRAGFDVQTIS
ncbi:MAG: 3-phosphoshikimate 1-carboxyvinyltransferase [Bacteroidia bacterium]|jgi:3-phosphoshikimate 1-carboxyvinyltransferase|nr:3-phosphoshikimate 1-carboxyvinyltransferase [Bacteroidia bacterium]